MKSRILPEKHLRNSESLLGIGAIILAMLKTGEKDVDSLWKEVALNEAIALRLHGSVSFDEIILAIDFLFLIGTIEINSDGKVSYASR